MHILFAAFSNAFQRHLQTDGQVLAAGGAPPTAKEAVEHAVAARSETETEIAEDAAQAAITRLEREVTRLAQDVRRAQAEAAAARREASEARRLAGSAQSAANRALAR